MIRQRVERVDDRVGAKQCKNFFFVCDDDVGVVANEIGE